MRYSQDAAPPPALTLESTVQPSPVINLYPPGPTPSIFTSTAAYSPDPPGPPFYSTATHHPLVSNTNLRRLGSNNTSSTGMHAHRSTPLPYPGQIRELYSPPTPAFNRRTQEHPPRSPSSFNPAPFRRNPISPTPSPNVAFNPPGIRMDSSYGSKAQQNIPPLNPTVTLGTLLWADGSPNGCQIKFDINGTIDKGFFLADNEWTCYRRNYFSCACSYALTPPLPPWSQHPQVQFISANSGQTAHVQGFAMSISAVVADNDGQTIDLVQHTPKRDKGPTAAPEKVRLSPKQAHPLGLFPSAGDGLQRGPYDGAGGFGPAQGGGTATEHTFERIQFKQATANNGKRRAAQQYYHLLVELFADTGSATQNGEQWIKIAYRKSAKMIVRGRSPGHYQSERRGSTSSGPGGSAGNLGGFGGLGPDFGSTSTAMMPGYGGTYDPRGSSHYTSGTRHSHGPHGVHEVQGSMDSLMSGTDEHKAGETKDAYSYYPSTIYEGSQDPRAPVEMFSHQSHHQHTSHHGHHQSHGHGHSSREHEGSGASGSSHSGPGSSSGNGSHHSATGVSSAGVGTTTDQSRGVKQEYEGNGLPSLFYSGPSYFSRAGPNCGRFESRSTSTGFYPTMAPQPGLNMTT